MIEKVSFDELRGKELPTDVLKQLEKSVFGDALESHTLKRLSTTKDSLSYPDQGLLQTEYDNIDYKKFVMLPKKEIIDTLVLRKYFLTMFNHPQRIENLEKVTEQNFTPPPKIISKPLENAFESGLALSIGDLGTSIIGSDKERTSRAERYAQGPFIKLGKQARTPFVGSDSPDVWNSTFAIATMAATHSIASIPRNGILVDKVRQADVAKKVFELLTNLSEQILESREDKEKILKYWQGNICGILEASPNKALERAQALYKAGVRLFRVYSPEPGKGPVDTVTVLRKEFGPKIEIFAGQIIDVKQAKEVEKAGADGIFVGIGGGGRCTTGVRSGSVIDWPELVWKLRGEINIPIVVEGGASDHVTTTLLLGASGIGVSRMVAGGTIESPGGVLYFQDEKGLYKSYGGEASARTKSLEGKMLPYGIPSFVEGETTKAYKSYLKHAPPTLTYNVHQLLEDVILSLVFRNSTNISELQAINPSTLRTITGFGDKQRNTH